ncbi:MFS transporter [Leptospira kobayashii]|uniref:MFS transporter n=1 Tax=Leptospira kobayashii TaxID=1917830 RepID=A0ABM7US76_9LEPT|nr:peptide MFS transporter [Leptospira kobayashii]BDA78711.1 MFS transporter [Leptospira kobayashii]
MEIQNQTIDKHPKGLPSLFLTEMWERMSYYGMRALLVLYLVKELHFSDEDAGQVYGLYTSLVYLTPVLGGYIADKYWGYKKAIYTGSFLMLLGHLSLAVPNLNFFYLGLGLIIFGNGFFKPNMSTLVGKLYKEKPGLRDSGFTIFYMGINLGGLLGPIVCGSLGEKVDWHYGFGAAGIGMAIGIAVFYFGSRKLPESVWLQDPEQRLESEEVARLTKENDRNVQKRIGLIVILSFFSIFFWMAFEQMGSSLNLFADRHTDRTFFQYEIPASFFQSINPLLILTLGPIFAYLWKKLSEKKMDPDPILKFTFSLFFLGLGFLIMVWASKIVSTGVLAGVWFLFGAYFWNTVSELFLSPVGLSFVSKTAPVKYVSMLMGIWFLSNAVGHYFAGYLSGYVKQFAEPFHFYLFFVITSWGAGALLFCLWFVLKDWLQKD